MIAEAEGVPSCMAFSVTLRRAEEDARPRSGEIDVDLGAALVAGSGFYSDE